MQYEYEDAIAHEEQSVNKDIEDKVLKKLLIDSVYDRVSRLDRRFVPACASIPVVVDEVVADVQAVQPSKTQTIEHGIVEESPSVSRFDQLF